MFGVQNYVAVAQAHEAVFRAILRDIKAHPRDRRTMCVIPKDLDTDAPIEHLFRKYSEGVRTALFTISDFTVADDRATISVEDVAPLSGAGATLEYAIRADKVEYLRQKSVFLS
jgi:hypothetical protein